MKYFLFLLSILLSLNTVAQEGESFVPDELVLKFSPEAEELYQNCSETNKFNHPYLDQLNDTYGLKNIRLTASKSRKNTIVLKFKTAQNLDLLIDQYMQSGLFEYAEPNYIGYCHGKKGVSKTLATPSDIYFFRQYNMSNNGSFPLGNAITDADVDMDLAWDIEQGDSNIIVAVLDAGIKIDHPDIASRLWVNKNETADGLDTDNNGFVDDTLGWNFAYLDNDLTDEFGHGTNVAGIIGAIGDNSYGLAGADWNCKLMILKVIDSTNFGLYTWWSEAIYYAVDNGAQVINMSLGGNSFSAILEDACEYAHDNDVTVVVSTGNDDGSQPFYPSAYPTTIAVGATGPDDLRVSPFFWDPQSGSNYGSHIDVVAPGDYIYGLHHISPSNFTSYWGGTSQAAPLVAGICSLLLSQDNTRTPNKIRDILRSTAEDEVGDPTEDVAGFDIYYGYGRVNAHQALTSPNVGIEETQNSSLSVYPIPTTETLTISVQEDNSTIEIYNSLGQSVYRDQIKNAQDVKLDASQFSKGAYILHIVNKKLTSAQKTKFLIN